MVFVDSSNKLGTLASSRRFKEEIEDLICEHSLLHSRAILGQQSLGSIVTRPQGGREVEVDAPGQWAFHCHLLYHMLGMFRIVTVS